MTTLTDFRFVRHGSITLWKTLGNILLSIQSTYLFRTHESTFQTCPMDGRRVSVNHGPLNHEPVNAYHQRKVSFFGVKILGSGKDLVSSLSFSWLLWFLICRQSSAPSVTRHRKGYPLHIYTNSLYKNNHLEPISSWVTENFHSQVFGRHSSRSVKKLNDGCKYLIGLASLIKPKPEKPFH